MMDDLKVLMLGWEFPPVLNGGLGVATLGITKALSAHAKITLILPKSDPDFIHERLEIIGLNNLELENIIKQNTEDLIPETIEVKAVQINLTPYGSEMDILPVQKQKVGKLEGNVFENSDLYGTEMKQRVEDFTRYVVKIASEIDFDIIHCHDWMTFPAGALLKKETGKPFIAHVHSLEYDRGGPESRGWIYETEKKGLLEADVIIPVSNYTGTIIHNHYQISKDKIYPVHNGADQVHVFHEAKDFPEKLILFLGRITNQKGPQYFIDIADKVIHHVPNVRFVMAGTGDQLRSMIESGADKQIGNKFHFTGFLDKEKVHKLFAIADVYCMPSVSEPFGLSALEAAQFGIPCVISKQSGVSEVLFGALKADYWETDKMAGHIISLLQNESLRESVIRDAFNDLEKCTWDRAAEKILTVYKKVV